MRLFRRLCRASDTAAFFAFKMNEIPLCIGKNFYVMGRNANLPPLLLTLMNVNITIDSQNYLIFNTAG